MRQIMIEDSKKFPGVTDGTTVLTNISGQSDGVRGDGYKIGGTRIDLDKLCGSDNSRCITKENPDGTKMLDANGKTQLKLDAQGRVQFNPEAASMSLADFLDESKEGGKMAGWTGGIQGWEGTLFGMSYKPDSWQDKLIEAFSGSHDVIGGKAVGLYDEQGDQKRGLSTTETVLHESWSVAAVLPSAFFAAADSLPPEVVKAISILLRGAQ
uniref:Uncharacterized protein n=1 Tax=Candidatus Kentrum sp. LPFa TaxID=2126335 RepID=A0A450VPL4_9GAMM|nr:MAG: hypothetical protein BECKLPF1236B_GA0070989_100214 [Candidatus Kentron sp. LPFa]